MTIPLSAAENFVSAIVAGDIDAAQKSASAESWGARVGSPRDLYEQATRKGFVLTLSGENRLTSERAAFECKLNLKDGGREVGTLWLLLIKDEEDTWSLDGVVKDLGLLESFIAGKIPARFAIEDLPAMPAAQAWGEGVLAALAEDFHKAVSLYAVGSEGRRQILWRLGAALKEATSATLNATYGSEALGRAQLGFEFDVGSHTDQIWVTIRQTDQDDWQLMHASSYSSAEALLKPIVN